MTRKEDNSGAISYFLNSNAVISAVIIALVALSGCASVNAQYSTAKPQHTPESFKNNYASSVNKSRGDFFRWQYERLLNDLPKAAQTPRPTVVPGLAFVQSNAKAPTMQPAITWVGHAAILVQANGLNVLTDSIFSERASPVQSFGPKRAQPPGLSIDLFPPIDVALISDNHYHHLDRNSVLALANRENLVQAATLFRLP